MPGESATKLARTAAELYIKQGQILATPWPLPPEFASQRACYVSIFEKPGRHFRSMFGRALPQQSTLAQEIISNTIEAIHARVPNKFRPVDFPYLVFSVAVVGPMERITSSVHLNPMQYGLYIRSDREKSSIILPQRTGIETGEDQIATAMREAGVDQNHESISMYRFHVTHYDG